MFLPYFAKLKFFLALNIIKYHYSHTCNCPNTTCILLAIRSVLLKMNETTCLFTGSTSFRKANYNTMTTQICPECGVSLIWSKSYCHHGSSCPRRWAGYPTSRWWSRWSPKSPTVEIRGEWLQNWGLRERKTWTNMRQRLEIMLYCPLVLHSPHGDELKCTTVNLLLHCCMIMLWKRLLYFIVHIWKWCKLT